MTAAAAESQTETVLHSFAASNGIFLPESSLIADAAGNLYGTAAAGGATASGAVFEVSPPPVEGGPWMETTLYTFGPPPDAENPMAGLVMDSEGALYGTTRFGGPIKSSAGAVYKLTPPATEGGAWTETILHIFAGDDGAYPMSQLIFDKSGNLWGTASEGGSGKGGVVFELTAPATSGGSWTYSTILNFPSKANSAGGCYPMAGLLAGPEGSFYGTAACGANNGGVAFKLTPPAAGKTQWGEAVMHAFGVLNSLGDGNYPQAGLIAGKGGVLFGTTLKGGSAGYGTVYELVPPTSGGAWTESVVHSFDGDGYNPEAAVTLGIGGALY
jgi:hypothetical protein